MTLSNPSLVFKSIWQENKYVFCQEKLRWVFQLYDADQSGAVSMSEMVILFAGIYQIEGIENRVAVDRAETVFGNLDINGDGDITEEEFVQGCLKVVNL